MKKVVKISIGASALLFGVFILFLNISSHEYANSNQEVVIMESDRDIIARTPEELFLNSDLVVVAKVSKEKENILFNDPYDGSVLSGHTVTEVQIKDIFKGSSDNKNVTLVEGYYIVDEVMFAYENYMPLTSNDEYLLFLKKAEESYFSGKYYIIEFDFGNYKVEQDNSKPNSMSMLAFEEQDFFDKRNEALYYEWYNYVMTHINELK